MSRALKKTLLTIGGSLLGVALYVCGIVWSAHTGQVGWIALAVLWPIGAIILLIIAALITVITVQTYYHFDKKDNPHKYRARSNSFYGSETFWTRELIPENKRNKVRTEE